MSTRLMALKWTRGWPMALAVLALVNLAATALGAATAVYEARAYWAVMWVILPLVGAATTFKAVRLGLNNYVAWFIPPVCETLAHWALIGYPPSNAGMVLLDAGLCLIAAAAAQVKNERDGKKDDTRTRREP